MVLTQEEVRYPDMVNQDSRGFAAKAYVELNLDADENLIAVVGTYPQVDIEWEIPEDFENGKDGAWL